MAWWLNLEQAVALVTSSVGRTAQDILELSELRGNWVYGNPEYIVHPSIDDPAVRILQYKIDNPAGPPIVY